MQRETKAKAAPWVENLRLCCGTMARVSPELISRLSLTVPREDAARSVPAVHYLCELIAGEYDLQATAGLEGQVLTVRLSRKVRQGNDY